jgi:small-conductance mechanosensitive channel
MRWARRLVCVTAIVAASMTAAYAKATPNATPNAYADADADAQTPDDGTAAVVEEAAQKAPVDVDGNVLFQVRGVSSLPATQRAAAIAHRIAAAAANAAIPLDAFRIASLDGQITIVAADEIIMAVLPADARLEDISPETLALAHLMRIRQAVASYREARSPGALRAAAVRSIVATLLLVAAILASLKFTEWLNRRLVRRLQSRIQTIGIQSFELMRAERIVAGLRSIVSGVRAGAIAASLIIYAVYVLRQWPWTRRLSHNLLGFVIAPLQVIANGFAQHLPSLIFLVVLFFVIRVSLKLLRLFFEAIGRGAVKFGGFDPEWAQPTYKIVRIAVIAFALVVAYPYIPGSESAAFKGVSLFLGVVFSLGSSTAIANIIAGYMMTYRRAFRVGDRVKVGDALGEVLEVRLQVTHMRSLKNEEIVIPNSQILANEVMNFSSLARTRGLILHTEVGIGYETPWRQVEAMLIEAAARTPGVSREPLPFVLLKKLGDFAVTYELNVFSHDVSTMHLQYTGLHRQILDVFNEYGVQIMTPAYEGDPERAKVVARSDWYTAPAAPPAASPVTSADAALSGVEQETAPTRH